MRRSIIVTNSLLISLVCASFLAGCKSRQSQAAGPPPAMPVTVAKASTQPAPIEIRLIGSVDPSARVEIKSQVAGQLMSVHFTEGQDVKEGDLLLQIDPKPYRDALQQAQAAVERDQAQLSQAEFGLQRDIVQSKSADAEAERYAALAREHVASQQQELQYRTSADALKQGIKADQSAIESARASIRMDQSAIDQAKLNLDYCEIHAPISGRAGNLLVHAGNLVKVNDVPLVVINQITPVFVSFNVPEKHLQAIRDYSRQRKLPVKVTSRDNPGAESNGYLSVLDNAVDTQTGTIHLKATFPNSNRMLWPGQFVDVVLTLNAMQNATVIPSAAVQAGQKGQFVYVVKPDKTVEMRVVSVGRTMDHNVVVDSGVQPGETVVTDGQMLLFPGAHVAIAAAPKSIGVE